jgi:hypothetical protein
VQIFSINKNGYGALHLKRTWPDPLTGSHENGTESTNGAAVTEEKNYTDKYISFHILATSAVFCRFVYLIAPVESQY